MNLTYEILSNGYQIFKNGSIWIEQIEPYIPQPNLSYEDNAKAQIAEIEQANANVSTTEQRLTDIELALADMMGGAL